MWRIFSEYHNNILLFASFLYLRIELSHKLRQTNQSLDKDTRN